LFRLPLLWLLELLLRLESLLGLLELLLGLPSWLLGLELGSISVELEILVGWVSRVDERVCLGLLDLLLLWLELLLLGLELEAGGWQLLASGLLSCWSRTLDRCWSLDTGRCLSLGSRTLGSRPTLGNRAPSPTNRARPWGRRSLLWFRSKTSLLGNLGVEGSRFESSGTEGNVVALQDPESVLAGRVFHCDRLPIVVDVAVLTDSLPVSCDLLPRDGSVLLSIS